MDSPPRILETTNLFSQRRFVSGPILLSLADIIQFGIWNMSTKMHLVQLLEGMKPMVFAGLNCAKKKQNILF